VTANIYILTAVTSNHIDLSLPLLFIYISMPNYAMNITTVICSHLMHKIFIAIKIKNLIVQNRDFDVDLISRKGATLKSMQKSLQHHQISLKTRKLISLTAAGARTSHSSLCSLLATSSHQMLLLLGQTSANPTDCWNLTYIHAFRVDWEDGQKINCNCNTNEIINL